MRITLALILLAALPAAAAWPSGAQSGRRKPPAPSPSPSGRTRTVARSPAPPSQENSPTPTPTPAATTPTTAGSVVVADDTNAPPARPRPTPAPTPAPSTKTDVIDDDDEVVRISSNLVPVPATVVDERGRAVVDLELKDFELKVDGTVRPIGDLSRSETPVALALLFDNSSSIRPAREFEKKAAVAFFRHVMRPIDRAAVFSISTDPEMTLGLTSDVRALVRAIESFNKPEGATALFDTVALAAEYLRPHRGRKVIVVVSDGTDTISSRSFDETLARVLAADCQVYSVQTGNSDNANLRDLAGERRLEEFAANTGGSVHAPRATSEFESAFSQIAADLAQQYVLGYYPPEELRDGKFHTLTVSVATRRSLRVRTRRGYYSRKS
ncbi:MAG TPA: VWA domain-containing protein [Pyrinomonadaceae bacterium]